MTAIPEWTRTRTILLLSLAATLVSAAKLLLHLGAKVAVTLGDSDDAMRLVLVRDLMAGRGWFDQHLTRVQPPLGAYLHWSRLLDGAIAAYELVLRAVASPAAAEWFMRLTWPMLWLFPAIAAGLVITRRLGGAAALFAGALLFMLCADSYGLFAPGRIDHHNVQITLCVVAAAAAVCSGERRAAAILAGGATGLGLAIGIEALPFYAVIGAALALRFVSDRGRADAVMAYGAALALTAAAAFVGQTPPSRWGVPACDALGINLAIALITAGLGLAAAGVATRSASAWIRAGAVAVAGLAAGAVYLLLDPSCAGGPMAAVDPSIRRLWFDKVDEIQPLGLIAAQDFPRAAALAAPAMVGIAAAAWVGLRRERRSFGWALTAALLLAATAAMVSANRMGSYVTWFAVPLVAWAVTDLAYAYGRRLMVSVMGLATLCSPSSVAMVATSAYGLTIPRAAGPTPTTVAARGAACVETAAYSRLAALPIGIVLAVPDLGTYILGDTRDSVIGAPYHRAPWGVRTSLAIMYAPPDPAADRVKALGVAYVVACKAWRSAAGTLERRLEDRTPPGWLEPVSQPGDTLQVYRLR